MHSNSDVKAPEEHILLRFLEGVSLHQDIQACAESELTRLCLKHKVLAPIACSLLSEDGIPSSWQRWALHARMVYERDIQLLALATKKTIALLATGSTVPVVLKGISLSLGRPRDAGDIDLLIDESSLLASIGILEAAGYVYQGYDRNMFIKRGEYRDWASLVLWSNQFEFLEPDTGALVELHTAFFETWRVCSEDLAPLRAAVGDFLAASVIDPETGYRFLALEDRVLLLALHAGLKRAPYKEEFVLRHLLDLRTLVSAGLDWKELELRAFRFGAEHHVAFLLRLYESFAGPIAPSGYADNLESRLSPGVVRVLRLHRRCLKGLDTYDRLSIFLYRLVSPFYLRCTLYSRIRSILVFPLLFPPHYSLTKIYGLSPRSPLTFLCYLLEPFRLVFRIVRKPFRLWKAAC